MSSSKRKVIEEESSDEESPRHHRSSLRVNLSVTNFTDSGNGSLKKSLIEENVVDMRRVTRSSRIKGESQSQYLETRSQKNVRQKNTSAVSDIHLKEVRIVLEDISKMENTLRKSCNELKNVILNKTREIFLKEDEVVTKSNVILGNHSLREKKTDLPVSQKDNVKSNLPVIVSDVITKCTIDDSLKNQRSTKNTGRQICDTEEQQENLETRYNITSTPKENNDNTQTDKSRKHKMKKKKLFTQDEPADADYEKLNVSPKTKFSETLITIKENRSPILAGSYKCVKPSKVSGINSNKLLKTDKLNHYQDVTPEIQHSKSTTVWPNLSIAQNENPIASSTMVEDSESGAEKVCRATPRENINTQTIKKLLSMEMTDVRGGFIVESTNAETDHGNLQCESEEISQIMSESLNAEKAVFNSPQVPITCKTLPAKNPEDLNYRNSTQNSITTESDSENSSKTIQTSLQVNTSIDAINTVERSKVNSPIISTKRSKRISSIFKSRQESKTQKSSEEESINSNHTSLQMNTSIIQSNRLNHENGDSKSKSICSKMSDECIINSAEKKNTLCEETRNLTKKLRDIAIPCSPPHSNSVRTSINLINKISTTNHTTTRNQQAEIYGTQDINEKSRIEATPYPPMRSLLLKSQLRQTHVSDLEKANRPDEANKLSVFGNQPEPTTGINNQINNSKSRLINLNKQNNDGDNIPQRNPLYATILLDDSPLPCERLLSNSITSVIIPDSSDENSAVIPKNTTINSTNTTIAPKKARKKLLPLMQNSQLVSFSPVEDQPISPKRPTYVKRRIKVKKKLGKATCNTQNSRNLTRNSRFGNDDHSPIEKSFPPDRKKKNSRKILSKKIVIKNIPDRDILEKLRERVKPNEKESFNKTRSPLSNNDFQCERMFHSQRHINTAQKIIIVTTGLSKEDKSLVRTIAKTLGRSKIESTVSRYTTHVVTTGVRTINLLHGIIRGCWLVSLQWVLKSLECNEWLNPEAYEMAHFSKAVMENRKDRQLFGRAYVPELFATCGLIYVQNTTSPPRNALKDLIKAAGGRITDNPETAKIIIGIEGLKESWVLDSITTGELQSYNEYQRG